MEAYIPAGVLLAVLNMFQRQQLQVTATLHVMVNSHFKSYLLDI